MTLTMSDAPLAGHPAPSNYSIDGPDHRIFFAPFPRRVRAELSGQTVIDTHNAKLLHETGIRARLYVPLADVRSDLFEPSETTSFCPFKGDAGYRSIRVGDAFSEDALWVYEEPLAGVPWLVGHAGVYEERFERWFDEDEEIEGHLRDPYTRVDAVPTGRHIVVSGPRGELLAETTSALLLSETGLQNRFYVPRDDVKAAIAPSDKRSVCPYKGRSSYWTVGDITDAAWSYEDPLAPIRQLAGRLSFDHELITVTEIA